MLVGVVLAIVVSGCGGGSADPARSSGGDASEIQFDQQLHDRIPQAIRDRGVIRFATDPSYAPMESYAPDGRTIVGFEPDLADALSAVLGVKVELVPSDFGTALDDTANGTFDAVLSAMTDTPEREQKVDFINYFSAGTSIIVQRGNPQGVADLIGLCGRVAAIEKATVQEDLLRRTQQQCGNKPIKIHTSKDNADALLQLRTGRAVAVLTDYPPAVHLGTDARTRAHYQLASTVQYEPGLYGIAVAKDNTALRDVVREALDQVIRSGAYAELLKRWDLTTGGVTSASINGGASAATGP
jgi:polar amino acid transport system substrate-binding protein